MNVLVLAPQPFYEDRGTPIAVDLMLQGLSKRGEKVDVLTYHVGRDVRYEGINMYRTRNISFIKQIPPGFSGKKLVCDVFMVTQALKMVLRKRYHYIHAVEEAVFIALLIKLIFKIPYIYDMDSSMAQQMLEKYPIFFKPLAPILNFFEGIAIRHAKAVVPVCDALSKDIARYQPGKVVILRDISLLKPVPNGQVEDLKSRLGLDGPMMMYVGNLESYQGIDLLLESFSLALDKSSNAALVVIGGKPEDIHKYQSRAVEMGIGGKVHFLGPKPVEKLSAYLSQADILVSPRIKGNNTPMKVYSYLDSGKALLATNLPTHTQVLNDDVAVLVEPSPKVFSDGVLRLLENRGLRNKLGKNGKRLVAEKHNLVVFQNSLNMLYDWLNAEASQVIQKPTRLP
jgi:glycosyltransferase involved in cell wall biosynthesis